MTNNFSMIPFTTSFIIQSTLKRDGTLKRFFTNLIKLKRCLILEGIFFLFQIRRSLELKMIAKLSELVFHQFWIIGSSWWNRVGNQKRCNSSDFQPSKFLWVKISMENNWPKYIQNLLFTKFLLARNSSSNYRLVMFQNVF